ncbi:MAG: alkaline phosphatase family protein [Gallicola sp.]|nr:alkaline phosphatase family protein [Gallicola sp.]
MNKLILIVLDGLNADSAFRHLGFMEHLVEQKKACSYTVKSELPTMSRPLYEVIQTGVPVADHGIYHNGISRRSKEVSLFQLVRENGGRSAAAAYHWVYDLYIGKEKKPELKRFALEGEGLIDQGVFYWSDYYPDEHLYADGDYLIRNYKPDYILIHPMMIDTFGHDFGSDSKEYMNQTVKNDVLLANYLPQWKEMGYDIIVTADHGMNSGGQHSGSDPSERRVPLFVYSDRVKAGDFKEIQIDQLEIAPFCCKMLNIEQSEKMIKPRIEVKE